MAYEADMDDSPTYAMVEGAAKRMGKETWELSDRDYANMFGWGKVKKSSPKKVRKSMPFRVFDRREQKFVSGPYESRQRASRRRDKLDDEYGGYNYAVVKVD